LSVALFVAIPASCWGAEAVLPGIAPRPNEKKFQDIIGKMTQEQDEIDRLRMKGDYDKMIEMFRRMRERIVKIGGETHPDAAAVFGGIATVQEMQGKFDDAIESHVESLRIVAKNWGTNNSTVANILGSIGGVHHVRGDYGAALAFYEASLAMNEKVLGAADPAVARSLTRVGRLYHDQGKYGLARPVLERSLAINEKAMGREHLEVASSLNNLATLYQDMGDLAEALSVCQRSVAIREKLLGTNDADFSTSLNNLAGIYLDLGDFAKAFPLYWQSLAIRERLLGPEHPEVATSLNNVASIISEFGEDHVQASLLLRRSLAIREKVFGPEHPNVGYTLNGLALEYQAQRRYVEAVGLFERTKTIFEESFGPEDARIATVLNNLAVLYREQDDYVKALASFERSLSIREKTFGSDHPDVLESLENLALLSASREDWPQSLSVLSRLLKLQRRFLVGQAATLSQGQGLLFAESLLPRSAKLHSLCGEKFGIQPRDLISTGAEQLALDKSLLEELAATEAAVEADPRTATREVRDERQAAEIRLHMLLESQTSAAERDALRGDLQSQLNRLDAKLAKHIDLLSKTIRERNLTLMDVARDLPPRGTLIDFVLYRPFDFAAKQNQWREWRYAAYLTFPLARDSTNVVVERVDLEEAAPINEAVELICRRMGAGQFRAKDLEAALQRVSELVYAPLARHLTNVSHLIVCPDGQLSRVPFEMLLVSGRGEPPRYLVEEKTVSYVGSGREVARLAQPSAMVKTNAPVVMGNPDFDFALPSSSRREEALTNAERSQGRNVRPHPGPLPQERETVRPRLGEAGGIDQGSTGVSPSRMKFLSRSYRGIKFGPLPGSEREARSVAKLLGGETVLRLGKEAREAELKAVVSPRVLHLATHGFFLTDQEFKRTNAGPGLLAASARSRRGNEADRATGLRSPPPHVGGYNDWENPMVRCGIALAGANHATNLMTRSSRREEAQTSNSGSEKHARPHPGPLPQEREKHSPRSAELGHPFGSDATNDQSLLTSAATTLDEEDGLLTGLEASLLNLQGTELVILSACESGAGDVKIGEGVMSLRRAFRIAGAETVLASHWKVDDQATSRLMTEFMRRWRAGEPRAKAWREAQLALLRLEKLSNPYFWAAFTLTGQWR
jgi:CHAT domain-containing protein/tetratricopeptide (TPR) repeat protein